LMRVGRGVQAKELALLPPMNAQKLCHRCLSAWEQVISCFLISLVYDSVSCRQLELSWMFELLSHRHTHVSPQKTTGQHSQVVFGGSKRWGSQSISQCLPSLQCTCRWALSGITVAGVFASFGSQSTCSLQSSTEVFLIM
jgi:hypothetical protein